MPPKASNTKASKAKSAQNDKRDEPLQAVVLADSFESRFKPLTIEKPRCLLPLVNIPIIEYTLEFLASNGVQEVIIYAGNHTDQVEDYMNASKWNQPYAPFTKIHFFKTAATSIGDFLRDLDSRDLMHGDFIVVSGDVLSNVELAPVLAKHRARREKDKNAIMTMILREKGMNRSPSTRQRRPVFVINPKADRCLHYEEVGGQGTSRYISLDPEFLTTNDEIAIREDLIDPHIDICTPDVLALWSDNFDFQSPRKSFLFGVLKDHELNGKTIHTHIVKSRYANRVASWKAYNAISKHLLERKVFPFGPESNILDDQTYQAVELNIYHEENVKISRNANIAGKCIIGGGTHIADRSRLVNAIIGRDCNIGANVTIEDSVIWENVTIEDGAHIAGPAIIAENVRVGAESMVLPGSILQSGINVEPRSSLPGRKLMRANISSHPPIELESDSDASSQASLQIYSQPPSISGSRSSISTFASSDDFEPDTDRSRRSSVVSDRSDENAAGKDFFIEATANIFDGLSKNESPDAIFLELNGYRMSVNATQHQLRHALIAACVKRVLQLSEGKTAKGPVQTVFTGYKSLLDRMLFDKDASEKPDQADLLLLMQKEVASKEKGDQLLLFITQQLYELEVIEEDGVLQWWHDPKSQTPELSEVRGLTEPFIIWLQETEETEDSEDDESE